MTRGRTRTAPTRVETPVQLLAGRKRELEGEITGIDRELRAGDRKRERLSAKRSAVLEELRGVDEAIERLGGLPKKEDR